MSRTACVFGCSGPRLTVSERGFFEDAKPLGFILFARNAGPDGDVKRLTDELQETAGGEALILTDHEGGRVQRFTGPGWRDWLPVLEQCRKIRPPDRLRALWLRYRIIASELIAAGINVNCVPVGDVASSATHPVLRDRCYSTDVEFVCEASRAVADACLAGGVLPVVKHIPGHGRPDRDSHLELPSTDAAESELAETDFLPFRKLNDLPLGMMAHVLYLSIDSERPSSQSEKVISIVRGDIGFDGLLLTDDLSMSALTGGMRERAGLCASAGCDVMLHCNGSLAEMEAAADAAGGLAGQAELRAGRALRAVRKPEDDGASRHVEEFRAVCDRAGVAWP